MENVSYQKEVNKVSIICIIGNVFLMLAKIITGILANSSSLISDGVHSGSDVFSTIIVMIGAKISGKKPDKDHPFGHERFESVACMILAIILGGTALILGYNGIVNIIAFCNGNKPTFNNYTYIALGFAVGSIVIKFLMYLYTIVVAKKINSPSLKADAYHHLSDSLSSFGSVLGIVGIIIGGNWSILDPICSIVIALFILKVAFDIGKDAIDQVVDKAGSPEYENKIKEIVSSNKNVKNINSIKTRQFANKYYVELEIAVDGNLSVTEGHKIANDIHDEIEEKMKDIKHCMVHVDPYEKTK